MEMNSGFNCSGLESSDRHVRRSVYETALAAVSAGPGAFSAVCGELLQAGAARLTTADTASLALWGTKMFFRSAKRLLFELCESEPELRDVRRAELFELLQAHLEPSDCLDCFSLETASQFGEAAHMLIPAVLSHVQKSEPMLFLPHLQSIDSAVDFLLTVEAGAETIRQAREIIQGKIVKLIGFYYLFASINLELLEEREALSAPEFRRSLGSRILLEFDREEDKSIWLLRKDRFAQILAGPGAGTLPSSDEAKDVLQKVLVATQSDIRTAATELIAGLTPLPEQGREDGPSGELGREYPLLLLTERSQPIAKRFGDAARFFELKG